MKKIIKISGLIISMFLLIFSGHKAQGQDNKNEILSQTIKVYGNCGMCKKRIENAAWGKGVKEVSWDQETMMLTVKYVTAKTSIEVIEDRVVKAGHDTDNKLTDENTYNNLHQCCKYERNSKAFKK